MVVIRGRFGKLCIECDEIIPRARIRANPKAKTCVGCQDLKEQRRAREMRIVSKAIRPQDVVIIRG